MTSGHIESNQEMESRLMGFRILHNGTDLVEMIALAKFVLNNPEHQEWFDEIVIPHVESGRKYYGETPIYRLKLAYCLMQMPQHKHLVPKQHAQLVLRAKMSDKYLFEVAKELVD